MKRGIVLLLALSLFAGVHAAEDFEALPPSAQKLLESVRSLWPTLDAERRVALSTAARQWLGLNAAQQLALRQRMQAWDALPPLQRAQRRSPFAAWQRLPAADQARVRLAAAAFTRLPAERQRTLRASFARLPPERQQAWWLGPELAPDVIAVGGLFAFVPESERIALLDVVRTLPASARMQLAQLTVRMTAIQLATLRRALIDASPEQRPKLIEQTMAR